MSTPPPRHLYAVNPAMWRVHHRDLDGVPPSKGKIGITFDLPVSPLPDPNATPPWAGYLMYEVNQGKPIIGTNLVYRFGAVIAPGTIFNYMSDPNNLQGPTPAAIHPIIKRTPFPDAGASDRWWSTKSFTIKDMSLNEELDVSLDPSEWTDVTGVKASNDPINLAMFKQSIAKACCLGLTFGGGWFYGHGVNVSSGSCAFNLYEVYSY